MKVIPLHQHPEKYTSRAYLILGDWNTMSDINTLIDPGIDEYVAQEILTINTGVGKKPLNQIILTHNHFDHAGGARILSSVFNTEIWQVHPESGCRQLQDGQQLKMGDRRFTVHVLPVHSNDSACLFCPDEGVLFSGDTPLRIQGEDGDYPDIFSDFISYLLRSNVKIIYPGHGAPIQEEIQAMLSDSLARIQSTKKRRGGKYA